MNYVTKNEKITKVQIEKIRKKALFLPVVPFLLFSHPLRALHPILKMKNALMDGAERR